MASRLQRTNDETYLTNQNLLMADPIKLVPFDTLITASVDEERHLAMKISRLIIKATQPN